MELFALIELIRDPNLGGITDSCFVDIINKF